MILGICGPIASGKSVLAQRISRGRIPIFELDEIGREVFEEPFFARRIFRLFKTCDRAKIAEIVFVREPEKLFLLEKILHPEMQRRLFFRIQKCRNAIVVAALPKTFGFEDFCDRIFCLRVPRNIALARVQKRGVSRAVFTGIERRQQGEKMNNSGISFFSFLSSQI